jgi:hypothetical protein
LAAFLIIESALLCCLWTAIGRLRRTWRAYRRG